MGGPGSGRWWGYRKKTCVEDCRKLDISLLRQKGFLDPPGAPGTASWGDNASVSIKTVMGDRPYLRMAYSITRHGEREDFDYRVPLVQVARFSDRASWLFACPFCGRRVGKLYLPPGRKYFGCRHCYNLTYRKRQQHDRTMDRYKNLPPGALLALAQELMDELKGPHTTGKLLKNLSLAMKLQKAALR